MRDRNSFKNRLVTKDPKTQLAYQQTLDSFEGYLSDNKLSLNAENAEDTVQSYINWFNITHSPNTVHNYYARIRKYLRHLKIYIDEVELPKILDKELYPLKLSDIHSIFEVLSYKDVTLFLTQLQAGLRIGETMQLRKKNFITEFDRIIIKIPPQIAKFKRGRTVIVGLESGKRLTKILGKINDEDLVFGTTQNVHSAIVNKEGTLRNSDEFKELSVKEKYPIRKDEAINTYQFHKNLCYTNHGEWEHQSQDKDGRLTQINSGYQGLSWEDSILVEMDYNLKFPNGHWQE